MQPNNEQETLALTMVGEARGEGLEGMQAVGNTVMNRLMLQTWFGSTVQNICLKKFQYSCWNQDDPNFDYLVNLSDSDPVYQQAVGIAAGLISMTLKDITNSATHYFRIGSPIPPWAINKTSCAHIGHHLFFKDIA